LKRRVSADRTQGYHCSKLGCGCWRFLPSHLSLFTLRATFSCYRFFTTLPISWQENRTCFLLAMWCLDVAELEQVQVPLFHRGVVANQSAGEVSSPYAAKAPARVCPPVDICTHAAYPCTRMQAFASRRIISHEAGPLGLICMLLSSATEFETRLAA
jgi:hypothetical protein